MKDLLDTIDLYDNNTSDMADGGRIGFKDGPRKILTGEKFIEIAEKFPDKSNVELLEYFNKNNFVNRTGDPLSLGAISTQKSKFFDVAAETKSKIPNNYVKSTDVFKNLPISKADYFRVKQAKEGGTLLTKEIDKLLKPVKIGETFYFKKPNKTDLKSFIRLADKTGRLNNRIADLMIEFDKVYGKNFANGIIPNIEDVKQKFDITDSTAGKVTTRLAQWYGGKDFKNTQLKNLKRNKVASNRMFKTIEKSQFGNPYRDGLYRISLETIDAKLGNKQGTFEKFKTQAKQILKDNKIPIYDPKMGKNAFGFNINEIAGVTGSARSKAAEFSQFVDVMDGNINTKAMAGFQSKFSTARQIIENDPTKLSVESKKINKMAQDLEKRYNVELPRLRDPDATKYFSPARLRELNAQGLDIVKAAERAGYTVEMPKSAQTIQEFIKKPNLKKFNLNAPTLKAQIPVLTDLFNAAKSIPSDVAKKSYFKAAGKALGLAFTPVMIYDTYKAFEQGKPVLEALEQGLVGTDAIGSTKRILSLTPEERLARSVVKQDELKDLNVDMPMGFGFIEGPTPDTDMTLEQALAAATAGEERVKKLEAEKNLQRSRSRGFGTPVNADEFLAGGGIAGLSGGIDKGPQRTSMNPDSQGLRSLENRVRNR